MAQGYPTPDNAIGDITFSCIPILVPSNPEFEGIFAAAIYGLYAQMSKEWFWQQSGTMTPEQAAFLASRGLAITDAYAECGGDMSCVDVADCLEENESITVLQSIITNNQAIINAITETVNNSGFGNPNHVNPQLTTVIDRNPIGALQEEIKPLDGCNNDKLWAGIREGIVALLNDTALDLLEDLAIIPSVVERLSVFIDIVPTMGDVVEGIVFNITEIIPDLKLLYESHESSAALDDLACEIFGIVCAECRYPTFEEVFNVYAAHTGFSIDLNTITLEQISEHILDVVFSPADNAFHTISTWALLVLNLQSAFNGASGTSSIVKWATLGEDSASNNWLDLCASCGDEYAIWEWDFKTQGQGDFYADTAQTTSKCVFVPGQGFKAVNHSTGRRADLALLHNPAWKIRAVAFNIIGVTSSEQWFRRPTWGSTTGQSASSAGASPCGDFSNGWDGYVSITGYNELVFFCQGAAGADITIDKVRIIYDRDASPPDVVGTSDDTICS